MRGAWVRTSLAAIVALALVGAPTPLGSGTPRPAPAPSVVSAQPRATTAAALAPSVAPRPAASRPTDTGCVIVRMKPGASAKAVAALGAGARRLGSTDLVTAAAPKGLTAEEFAAQLADSPLVDYAEPDYLLKTATNYTSTPNDPDFSDPYARTTVYGYPAIPHARSWALRGTGSADFDIMWPALASANATAGQVHIAVIDTGFYFDHPDAGPNIRRGIDECATYDPVTSQLTTDTDCRPVPDSAYALDPNGTYSGLLDGPHGTMTASEMGAAADNGVGGLGAAYDTEVDVYKVMGVYSRSGYAGGVAVRAGAPVMAESALVNAIYDATNASVARGYRLVISISLVLDAPPSALLKSLTAAVAYAKSRGVVIVAASGNEGIGAVSYPAALPGVIAVGAYTMRPGSPTRAGYSNYGSALALLAPGSDIWGPTRPDVTSSQETTTRTGYEWWEGTSMATPYVASAAALLLRMQPDLTAAEVASYLAGGAFDMGAPGWDQTTGWGRLDVYHSFFLLAVPRTSADIHPRYGGTATIDLTATSRRAGQRFTTYIWLDDAQPVPGTHIETSVLGTHRLTYWSVGSDGFVEPARTATFAVLPPDTTPPSTAATIPAAYTGLANIALVASDPGPDAWGVAQTQFSLDGAAARTGTLITTGRYGSHVLRYWSVDLAGNVEATHTAAFTVRKATPSLRLLRSASSIRRYAKLKLSGTIAPARVGDYARVQFQYPGSHTWRNLTSSYARRVTTVSSSGAGSWAALTATLTRHGTYHFRVYFAGDTTYISRYPRYSNTASVYVR